MSGEHAVRSQTANRQRGALEMSDSLLKLNFGCVVIDGAGQRNGGDFYVTHHLVVVYRQSLVIVVYALLGCFFGGLGFLGKGVLQGELTEGLIVLYGKFLYLLYFLLLHGGYLLLILRNYRHLLKIADDVSHGRVKRTASPTIKVLSRLLFWQASVFVSLSCSFFIAARLRCGAGDSL